MPKEKDVVPQFVKNRIGSMIDDIFSDIRDDYDTTVHASNIYDYCLRRTALHIMLKNEIVITDKQRGIATAMTYLIGRQIQKILTDHTPDLVGIWKCRICKKIEFGKKPGECVTCGHSLFKYEELRIIIPCGDHMVISGSMDHLIRDVDNKTYFEEVKSIKPEVFDTLVEPEIQHVYQVQPYLWMIAEAKGLYKKDVEMLKLQSTKAYVTYVCKTQKQMPMKTFTIYRDKKFMQRMNTIAKGLKSISKLDTGLPERICSTPLHPMARNCKMRGSCFEKHGAGL